MAKRRGQGEGGIRKRADGRWEGTISSGYVNGKRKRTVVYARTRTECAKKLREAQAGEAAGFTVDGRMTTEQLLKSWLKNTVRLSVKPSTLKGYETCSDLWIVPHIGWIPVARLDATDIDSMLSSLEDKGLSTRTRHMALGVLRLALKHALKRRIITRNVADAVDAPRGSTNRAKDALSRKERDAMLKACKGERFEAFAVLAFALGLRRGELLGLRWCDVDFESNEIRIVNTLNWIGGTGFVLGTVKTRGSHRTVPLLSGSRASLRAQQRVQKEDQVAAGDAWRDEGYVFATHIGGPISPRNIARWWHLMSNQALGRNVRIHAARHTAAVLMLEDGVPLETVSAILGHASHAITMDIYGHIGMKAKARGLSVLDGGLDQPKTPPARRRIPKAKPSQVAPDAAAG
jgi:integrase